MHVVAAVLDGLDPLVAFVLVLGAELERVLAVFGEAYRKAKLNK